MYGIWKSQSMQISKFDTVRDRGQPGYLCRCRRTGIIANEICRRSPGWRELSLWLTNCTLQSCATVTSLLVHKIQRVGGIEDFRRSNCCD